MEMTPADYARALELWPNRLLEHVTNALVIPTWVPGEDRFWYRHERSDGHEFVLVDAGSGDRRPAFDHELVGRALGADPAALPIERFESEGDGLIVELTSGERCGIAEDGRLSRLPGRDLDSAAPKPEDGFAGPDGELAFVRDHDLWVREPDGAERRLTDDGEPHYAWATAADADLGGLEGITRDNLGVPQVSQGVFWSPEGDRLFVCRVDERRVTRYPYMESIRPDGGVLPRVHDYRFKLFGDAEETILDWYVVDAVSGDSVRVDPLPEDLQVQPWLAWWTPRGTVLGIAHNVAQDALGLVEVTPETGAVRIVHLERDHMLRLNDVWFNEENVRYLPERDEMIWWSQGAGSGHLFAISVETGAIRPLTEGDWMVFDLQLVTGTHAFFTAGGVHEGVNPYYRFLHRVDLDGGPNAGLRCLTPEPSDHAFPAAAQGTVHRGAGPVQQPPAHHPIAPSGRFFVDNISRVDQPTVTVLRDADGNRIAEVARADASGLERIGWQAPETFCVKAADGETDLWGVLLTPRGFDGGDPLPVVERIYGGHQVLTQPRSFLEMLSGSFMYGMPALADLGFAVVTLDGPGTPYRSRAFRDATWNTADRFGIADHRAAIERLADTRPWLDLDRVGVNGHSSGGYTSLMCLLLEPDFYRVGVSSSPMLEAEGSGAYVTEPHLGRPDFGGGRRTRNSWAERAPSHVKYDPASYVHRLAGKLMLMYGDIDAQCQPQQLLQFMGKLVAAGKTFDTQVMPGESHYYTTTPYYQKRLWDYFVEHLQGREPLRHHPLPVEKGQRLSGI